MQVFARATTGAPACSLGVHFAWELGKNLVTDRGSDKSILMPCNADAERSLFVARSNDWQLRRQEAQSSQSPARLQFG